MGDKLGDKGDKTSGRQTHHPTQGTKKGDNRKQNGETRPSGKQTHHPTQADTGRQDRRKADAPSKAEAPSNTGTHVGRQWEAIGNNGKQFETTGNKDRQEWRRWETRPREGGHTIQHRHTCMWRQWETIRRQDVGKADRPCGETIGDKTSGRRTHHPTQAHMW